MKIIPYTTSCFRCGKPLVPGAAHDVWVNEGTPYVARIEYCNECLENYLKIEVSK